jgi:hypothetical protein
VKLASYRPRIRTSLAFLDFWTFCISSNWCSPYRLDAFGIGSDTRSFMQGLGRFIGCGPRQSPNQQLTTNILHVSIGSQWQTRSERRFLAFVSWDPIRQKRAFTTMYCLLIVYYLGVISVHGSGVDSLQMKDTHLGLMTGGCSTRSFGSWHLRDCWRCNRAFGTVVLRFCLHGIMPGRLLHWRGYATSIGRRTINSCMRPTSKV